MVSETGVSRRDKSRKYHYYRQLMNAQSAPWSVRKDIAEPEDESQARLSDILALTRIRWMEGALGRPGRQRHFVGVHHR